MIMLVGSQDIRQFPVELLAEWTFQSTEPKPDFCSASQTVMTFAGVPVFQFNLAVRANWYLPARK